MEGGRVRDGKRVRFSYEEPDPDDDEEDRPRKLKFPKGKKAGVDRDLGEEDEDELSLRDARVAATERAVRRNVMDEQLRSAEDGSNINDVTEAEEEYEEKDDEEIKLEPFNLNAERRDGFFDDDGHYVEYATKYEARDAWLDSVEVDTRFAEKHLAQTDTEESELELSPQEIGRIKKRIADALEPGETILEGLRRLRGSAKDGNRRQKLTGSVKIVFDQLTEDAMKLMDMGEIDVYEKPQEKFRREADAVLENDDIFGDEPAEEAAAAAGSQEAQVDSGYVYDKNSGYYYNAELGYFYDPNSGLYCSGASGQWYKFDEEKNTYVEAV